MLLSHTKYVKDVSKFPSQIYSRVTMERKATIQSQTISARFVEHDDMFFRITVRVPLIYFVTFCFRSKILAIQCLPITSRDMTGNLSYNTSTRILSFPMPFSTGASVSTLTSRTLMIGLWTVMPFTNGTFFSTKVIRS